MRERERRDMRKQHRNEDFLRKKNASSSSSFSSSSSSSSVLFLFKSGCVCVV